MSKTCHCIYKQKLIKCQRKILSRSDGTITHNRARGTHLLEPMKAIVKRLIDEGKTVQEISKQLGMRAEEVFRLTDFTREDFLNMMTQGTQEYSKAQIIRKV